MSKTSEYQREVLGTLDEIAANTRREQTDAATQDWLDGQRYYKERRHRQRERWKRELHRLKTSKWRAEGACPLHGNEHFGIVLVSPSTGDASDVLCPHVFWLRCCAILVQQGRASEWIARHPWGYFVRGVSAK